MSNKLKGVIKSVFHFNHIKFAIQNVSNSIDISWFIDEYVDCIPNGINQPRKYTRDKTMHGRF